MHIGYRVLRELWCGVQDICNASVGQELLVDRHFQVLDLAKRAEHLTKVQFVDVLRELFHHNLGTPWTVRRS